MLQSPHTPVLLKEVLAYLCVDEDLSATFIDGTLGYAGHSYAMLLANKNLKLLACDKDSFALKYSSEKLKEFKNRIKLVKCGFKDILNEAPKDTKALLLDLGVSSFQLDCDERGFSKDSSRLDMRMNESQSLSAKEIINEYSANKLEEIFKKYSELRNAKALAQKIVQARSKALINSVKDLSSILGNHKLAGRKVSELTLVCQGLRIEVNQELLELEIFLKKLKDLGLKKARVGIISFHSLEDRIVKNTFKSWAKNCLCDPSAQRCLCGGDNSLGKILTKKPVVASKEELRLNSRASCAKLRVFEFKA